MVTLPATLDPQILISWDGSADFDGDHDDVTNDALADPGVAISFGRQDALTLSPPKVADGGVDLHNESGAYSQERADSPVYQRVLPARPVLYQTGFGVVDDYDTDDAYDDDDPYDGYGTFPLGRHLIQEIAQQTDIGDQRVKLTTLGYEVVLTRAMVTVGVMTSPRVDECISALLDAAGWPADRRDVGVSDTTLLYWWCDERTPWDAMLELLAAEGPGTFYVDREGVFHFENRNYRTLADRSTTSQAEFWDRVSTIESDYDEDDDYDTEDLYDGVTSGLWFAALRYEPGFRNLYNRATYTTRRRTLGSLSAVWSYGSNFALTSGQSRTLIARPSDPFQNAVTPTDPTDYTVAGGTVSVTLAADSGLVAYITVTATSGTPTVSDLQLRAEPLTVVSETTIQNGVDASASIARFSPIPGQDIPIPLTVSGWPEIDPAMAEAVCDAWVNRYMLQRPQVTITLRNADGEHLDQILRRRISDRITLFERNTGLEADVWINAISLRISGGGGRVVECEFGCEKVEEVTGAVWDESLWDAPESIWGI